MSAKASRLKRDPNYWGRDAADQSRPVEFRQLRFDYYRDANAYFEAFKAGLYDVRSETDPTPLADRLRLSRRARRAASSRRPFPTACRNSPPTIVFNTRRPIFADIRVRQAIALLVRLQWINRNFFFDLYKRSASFFDDSELSAYHRAADARERALLAPYPDAVRADVLDGTWSPPVTDGSGRDRDGLRQALALLAPPATSSTARCCATAPAAGRCTSRSW